MNLLTEKEKIFLSCLNFDYIEKYDDGILLFAYSDNFWDRYCLIPPYLKLKFKGLKSNKQYTRKELGL